MGAGTNGSFVLEHAAQHDGAVLIEHVGRGQRSRRPAWAMRLRWNSGESAGVRSAGQGRCTMLTMSVRMSRSVLVDVGLGDVERVRDDGARAIGQTIRRASGRTLPWRRLPAAAGSAAMMEKSQATRCVRGGARSQAWLARSPAMPNSCQAITATAQGRDEHDIEQQRREHDVVAGTAAASEDEVGRERRDERQADNDGARVQNWRSVRSSRGDGLVTSSVYRGPGSFAGHEIVFPCVDNGVRRPIRRCGFQSSAGPETTLGRTLTCRREQVIVKL